MPEVIASDALPIHRASARGRVPSVTALNLVGAAVATLVWVPADAAPPTAFDGWSLSNGNISATCPAGFTCQAETTDSGMLQRTLRSDSTGQEYIQLILSESAANGPNTLSTESFVALHDTGGIAAKQTYSQSGADTWNTSAIFNTGWANQPASPAVQLSQSLATTYQGIGYTGNFSYSGDEDTNGNRSGFFVDIRQRLTNTTALPASTTTTTGQDIHTFVYRRAQGTRVPAAGSATLPPFNIGGGMMGGMGGGAGAGAGDGMIGNGFGGTVTWQAGADVSVAWIGQFCQGCPNQDGGGMGGGGGGGGMGGVVPADTTFSYQTFDNLVDALPPIATGSIVTTNPFTWPNPPFGTPPSL